MDMFMTESVLAGLAVVGLTVAFMVGFGVFVWKDAHSKKR